jgi:hypothetical protein
VASAGSASVDILATEGALIGIARMHLILEHGVSASAGRIELPISGTRFRCFGLEHGVSFVVDGPF